jgi:hypothetical protein
MCRAAVYNAYDYGVDFPHPLGETPSSQSEKAYLARRRGER